MKMMKYCLMISAVLLLMTSTCWSVDSLFVSRVGMRTTGEQAYDVKVLGNYAYVANDDSGLRVIDITDPTTPIITGHYNCPGWVQGLNVVDSLVYLATRASGLQIVSVADPANPVARGSIVPATGSVRGVCVIDTIAYVAADVGGLYVYSVANPAAPSLLGSITTPGNAYAVKVVGTTAYVASFTSGFTAVDVTSIGSMTILQTLAPGGGERVIDVCVDGNRAFLASITGTYQHIVNIASPSSMRYVDSIAIPNARGVTKIDTLVCWASADSGLNIASYTGSHPSLQAYHRKMGNTTRGVARGIAVRDSFAYLAADSSGLVIYNFGRVYFQQHIWTISPTTGDTLRSRDYTTIGWNSINVEDSVKIQISRATPQSWTTIGRAAVSDGQYTWRVYNPFNLVNSPCVIRVISLTDSTIFGVSPTFIIKGPLTPLAIISPARGESWDMNTLHTIRWANSEGVNVIVKVIRNSRTTRIGFTTDDSLRWTVTGDTASSALLMIAQYPDSFYSAAISVAIRLNGVDDPVLPTEFKLEPAYPNPFNASTVIRCHVPSACESHLAMYDLLGKSVLEQTRKLAGPGAYEFRINGENLASGVYLVRFTAGRYSEVMKVVLLK